MTETTQDLNVEARSSMTLPGMIAPPLAGFGTASAIVAVLTGGQIAALLAIAGLVSAGLFAIADALRQK